MSQKWGYSSSLSFSLPSFPFSSPLLLLHSSLHPSLVPCLHSLPPSLHILLPLLLLGCPTPWSQLEGLDVAWPSNGFGAFWGENRPLLSVEEVYWRQTSITSQETKIFRCRTPQPEFLMCPAGHQRHDGGCGTDGKRSATTRTTQTEMNWWHSDVVQ